MRVLLGLLLLILVAVIGVAGYRWARDYGWGE